MQYVDFKVLENCLRISLIVEVDEIEGLSFEDIVEHQICNGWDWIHPEDVGALTDSPILSNSAEYDEDYNLIKIDSVFWYPNYQIHDIVKKLIENGHVDFDMVK
jgi:hypothetical protein